MKYGLDTNILVRLFHKDDPAQTQQAREFILSHLSHGDQLFVSNVVLCELVWVSRRIFRVSRLEIQNIISNVLDQPSFEFEDKDLLIEALADYANAKGDFSDYLLGRLAAARGCQWTYTFDSALRGSGFKVLKV